MKKINKQIIEEVSMDNSRRNFLKKAGIGALGIAGIGFSFPEIEASENQVKRQFRS